MSKDPRKVQNLREYIRGMISYIDEWQPQTVKLDELLRTRHPQPHNYPPSMTFSAPSKPIYEHAKLAARTPPPRPDKINAKHQKYKENTPPPATQLHTLKRKLRRIERIHKNLNRGSNISSPDRDLLKQENQIRARIDILNKCAEIASRSETMNNDVNASAKRRSPRHYSVPFIPKLPQTPEDHEQETLSLDVSHHPKSSNHTIRSALSNSLSICTGAIDDEMPLITLTPRSAAAGHHAFGSSPLPENEEIDNTEDLFAVVEPTMPVRRNSANKPSPVDDTEKFFKSSASNTAISATSAAIAVTQSGMANHTYESAAHRQTRIQRQMMEEERQPSLPQGDISHEDRFRHIEYTMNPDSSDSDSSDSDDEDDAHDADDKERVTLTESPSTSDEDNDIVDAPLSHDESDEDDDTLGEAVEIPGIGMEDEFDDMVIHEDIEEIAQDHAISKPNPIQTSIPTRDHRRRNSRHSRNRLTLTDDPDLIQGITGSGSSSSSGGGDSSPGSSGSGGGGDSSSASMEATLSSISGNGFSSGTHHTTSAISGIIDGEQRSSSSGTSSVKSTLPTMVDLRSLPISTIVEEEADEDGSGYMIKKEYIDAEDGYASDDSVRIKDEVDVLVPIEEFDQR